MSDAWVELAQVPSVPLEEDPGEPPIPIEGWREFADNAAADIPCIVDRLWPEGALGFIASPPKKGKTWLGLSLALSVATATPFLGQFPVPAARTVLYVALEGHRAALKARIGCLARGLGVDPDEEIERLKLTYKPRGLNIADPVWANHLIYAANGIQAGLVIVDVLRAAALIKESAQEDFAALRSNLAPLLEDGRSLAFLHHFTKLSEISKERTPAERMSGSGAMYGALDVGIFITGSEKGARKLRLDFDGRDLAMPETLGVQLGGVGHGDNGGLTYHDRASWEISDVPDEDRQKITAEEIADWLRQQPDQEATLPEMEMALEVSRETIDRRAATLRELGIGRVEGKRGGRPARYYVLPEQTPEDEQLVAWEGDEAKSATKSAHNPQPKSATPPADFKPAWLSQNPANPQESATDDVRISENGDLQGLHQIRKSASPKGDVAPAQAQRDTPTEAFAPQGTDEDEQNDDFPDTAAAAYDPGDDL